MRELLGEFLFPGRCVMCDRVLRAGQRYFCGICGLQPREVGEAYCLSCGKPVESEREFCRDCAGRSREFQGGRSALLYDSAMRRSMGRFKYRGRQEYAVFYGEVLAEKYGGWIREAAPEALLPVPLHPRRQRKRGYNQAELVARELGVRCGIPVDAEYLFRQKDTLPQKELSRRERQNNLRQAFCTGGRGRGKIRWKELSKYKKCVIIVDDIYTTGSTVEACARALRAAGTERVYFLCVCTGEGD